MNGIRHSRREIQSFFQPDIQESVRFHVVIHSLPLVKFRAPHRDARRTLSSPTRRAPHFFSYARLCATFLGSSTDHRTTYQLACFARLPTGEASSQNLASRCASESWWFMWDGGLVHPCNYRRHSLAICLRSKLLARPCRLTRRAALKGMRAFLNRAGVWGLGITTRKAAEGTRAHFCAGLIVFFALVLTHKRLAPPPCPKAATKCVKPGCSGQSELAVDMVDRAEATPGLSGALLAAPWRAW